MLLYATVAGIAVCLTADTYLRLCMLLSLESPTTTSAVAPPLRMSSASRDIARFLSTTTSEQGPLPGYRR